MNAPAPDPPADRPAWNPSDDEEIVEVATCADDVEAGALAAALNAAGVPCNIVQGGAGVGGGGLPLGQATEPKLWVREHDAPAARKVIADMRADFETAHNAPHEEE